MTVIVHPTEEGYQLANGRIVRVWSGLTDRGTPVRLHVTTLELPADHDERLDPGFVHGPDPRIPRG